MEVDQIIPKLNSVDSENDVGHSSQSSPLQKLKDSVEEDDYLANQILSLIPLSEDDPEAALLQERIFDFICFDSGEFACFEIDCFNLISRYFRIFGNRDSCIAVAISREAKNPYAPVIYSPEQVSLLQDIGHARVLRSTNEKDSSEAIHIEIKGDNKFAEIDEQLLVRARSATIGRKRKQMMKDFADLPKSKRPKISDDQIEVADEEILATCSQMLAERKKRAFTPLVSLSDSLIPLDSSCFPQLESFRRRNIVFKNLWHRGYYLSCGFKFACDYLVYDGEPGVVHSSYICHVKSVEDDISFKWMQMHGRIAKSVKKEILIAFVDAFGEVYYQKQSYWNAASKGKGAPKHDKPFHSEDITFEEFMALKNNKEANDDGGQFEKECKLEDDIEEIIDKDKKATATCWEDLET